MKAPFSNSLYAFVFGLEIFGGVVSAADFKRRDGVHRLERAHVTAFRELGRRDATCAAGYETCAESLSGGCCQPGYSCATDSCYATTSATRTCAGYPDYYECDSTAAGGCCPKGYICQRGGNCLPASGVAYAQECPTSYYLCPASLDYGCCRNGLGCAKNACYSTDPSTYIQTTTITTTDDAGLTLTTAATTTNVITPTRPSAALNANPTVVPDDPGQPVFKIFPTAVAKQQPTGDDDGGSDSLTTAQIAGIVAGGVGLLIIVLVAAWIIIRHLNKVVKAVESSNRGTSTGTKSRPSMYQFKPTPSEVDDMSVDPLMMSPRPSHRRNDSDTTAQTFGPRSPEFTPPYGGTPGSIADYQAVPNGTERHASYNSTYAGGYFDGTDRSNRNSQDSRAWGGMHRQSTDSQGTYAHLRNWSNASEASSDHGNGTPAMQELDSTPYVPELAATPVPDEGRRRAGSLGMSRPPAVHQRRRSSEGGGGRSRSDSAAGGGLSAVSEDTEVSGHYGSLDRSLGQMGYGK